MNDDIIASLCALSRKAESNPFRNLVSALRSLISPSETEDDAEFERKHPRGDHGKFSTAAKERSNINRATPTERASLEKGRDPEGNRWRRIAPTEIPTVVGTTKSVFRKIRNRIFAAWQKHKTDGSYTLDGKLDNPKTGFQVSFQTTRGEGYDGTEPMTDAEYDRTVKEIMKQTGASPRIGVFGGIPEISFTAPTREMAMEIGIRFHQQSICNNEKVSRGEFDYLTFPECSGYSWDHNPLHRMKDEINPFNKPTR